MIDSGDFPSAAGKSGGDLDRTLNKWAKKINGGFSDGAEWLLKAIEEVDRLELWKTYWGGFYKTRESFIQMKVLYDFKVVEETIPAIAERLRSGESVSLDKTTGERVEFVPTLRGKPGRPNNVDKNENVNNSHDGGNGISYRLAKLKRDAPEIAERYLAGEFPNVREAERAAGLPVPAKLTQLERVLRAFERLSLDDKIEFCNRIDVNP